ncbi:MAG TPA: PBP1A family penicillin-binding protein [Blastocatellia bacterium]
MRDREKGREEWRPPEERGGDSRPVHSVWPALEFPRIPLGSGRAWRRILAVLAIILIPFAAIGGFKLHEAYTGYSAIVDKRLVQEAQRRRAGVYAAPRRVSVGQQISQDELRDRLLRAGYRQSRSDDPSDRLAPPAELEAGAFITDGDAMRLRLNSFDRDAKAPESVNIKFNRKTGGRIVQIENAATGGNLQRVALPPESLTPEIGTTTLPRGVGIQARFEDFPPSLIDALTAIEDRNFFSHHGVDGKAVLRALWENWRHGEIREGGSTITQQLVKTNFLTPERTYERKFAEAMMAIALERRMSKEEIFTVYANHVYLGQSGITAIYGFKEAARVYFGKELKDLSLAESALIAGLTQAPNRYSPYQRPVAAVTRRNTVLDAMANTGSISPEEAEAAKSERLSVIPPGKFDESAAHYFLDDLKRELANRNIGEKEGPDLEIRTTLDLDLQRAANVAVNNYIAKLDRVFSQRAKKTKGGRPEAALIAINPHTGEILAMVGGRDYASSQLNRVTDARRQPGSVFKPIVYAAALAGGISPETFFYDAPHEIIFGNQIYRPQNYGGSFSNQLVTLREGIVRSLNVVTVNAAITAGLSRVADIAEKMGLPRPEPYPSMALGAVDATPFEIARAYSTFANGGVSVTPFGIKSITRDDKTEEITTAKTSVLHPSVASVVTETLAEAVDRGTATTVRRMGYLGPVAGKTGSSHDAWFAGYTPNLLAVVWVGFDDYHNLGMVGGDAAAPIWTDFIKRATAARPDLR